MLVHYIIVRRDLPLGKLAAMITHAAGESAVMYRDVMKLPFHGAIAVVLEAKNEQALYRYAEWLTSEDILFVSIHESDEPYIGQLMAIGVVPCERDWLSAKMRDLQTLKTCLADEPENSG